MAKALIYTGPMTVHCTEENNIILGPVPASLLRDIFNIIFEDNWRQGIHPIQKETPIGSKVYFIEINGKAGWFRPSDDPPMLKSHVKDKPAQTRSIPISDTVHKIKTHKSSLSFLTRLFRF